MNSLKRVRAFQIELEFGVLVFKERGKTGVPGKKPVEARENFVHISLRSRNTTYDKSCSLLFYKVIFFTEGSKLVIFWFFFSTIIFSDVVKRHALPCHLKNYADLLLSSSIHIAVNDLIDTREVYLTINEYGLDG